LAFERQRSAQGDAYIHFRINRNVSIAVIVSLLLHALALFLLSHQDLFNQHQPATEQPQTITVRLNPQTAHKPVETAPIASTVQPPPVIPSRQMPKPKTQPPPVPHPELPKVIAVTKAEPTFPPPPTAQRAPVPSQPELPDPAQFPDMASYVNAVRERRRMAGGDAGSINEEAVARERERSEEEIRNANLKRNPQPSGTNGIFQIISMDAHTGTFAFRGWKNEFSYSHREVYEVNAGQNGDVARALVRKMIEIIRRYYTGDFNWESQRLGHVVVLSARLQDNDGLEDFMLQEFFGSRGISAR
jgi:outer membrane biosynthesis protein TonB